MMQKPRVQPRYVHWLGILGSIMLAALPTATLAQIAGDGTLGTQVNGNLTAPCTGTCIITNGATRGSNLFHSFQQFSLPNNDFAGFVTTPAIQNVIVRVTGVGQPFISTINGTIQTSNPANFFLLNPNGILFGPGVTLNIGGSFLATTVERMVFQDGIQFTTTDPAPLLTVSVPVGLQFGQTPGSIQTRGSRLQAGQTNSFGDFALVGGKVTLDNTTITTPGRQVELAGVTAGRVDLDVLGNALSLNLPVESSRGDVAIANRSFVDVTAEGGGNITINARNLDILQGSVLATGIGQGLGRVTSRAGDITLNATESVKIQLNSRVTNTVGSNLFSNIGNSTFGNSGNIYIVTGSFVLTSGSELNTGTFGYGNAGNIIIDAHDAISFDGKGLFTVVSSGVENAAVGSGGNVSITTKSFSLKNRAGVNATTSGFGNAGNINIDASDTVYMENGAFIRTTVNSSGVGRVGTLHLTTDSLFMRDASGLGASIFGNGMPGSIIVNARDAIYLDQFSFIASSLDAGSGQGGDIRITTGSLFATNGGNLRVTTAGQGNAGNITINAQDTISFTGRGIGEIDPNRGGAFSFVKSDGKGQGGNIYINTGTLSISNGAQLVASTLGRGDAGNIMINARNSVFINGIGTDELSSGLFTTTLGSRATGKGGDITINTSSFLIIDGAVVSARTSNLGSGGDVTINADTFEAFHGGQVVTATRSSGNAGNITLNIAGNITLTGSDLNYAERVAQLNSSFIDSEGATSGLFANTAASATGRGGNITLETPQLTLQAGARIATTTDSVGNAGNITVRTQPNAQNLSVQLDSGTSIAASTANQGTGGNLTITAPNSVTIQGEGILSAETQGTGNAGNINISTQQLTLSNGTEISASTASKGQAGNITVTANALNLSKGARILTNTAGIGQAGNITLNVNDELTLIGTGTGLFASTAKDSTGDGGSITIDPRTVLIQDGAAIAVNSQGGGQGGNIQIQAGRLTLDQQGVISAQTASNQGGNITLNVPDLLLRHGSLISTTAGTAQAGGDGGKININSQFIVAVLAENSDITANAFTGSGGSVDITAQGIFGLRVQPQLTPLSDITASSRFGINGTVTLNVLNLDPSRGLVALPLNLTDPSQQISQDCKPGGKTAASSFVSTGRGGIPLNPDEPLESRAVVTQWVALPEEGAGRAEGAGGAGGAGGERRAGRAGGKRQPSNDRARRSVKKVSEPMVEAQGWVARADGTIELVDNNAVAGSSVPGLAIATCQNSLP